MNSPGKGITVGIPYYAATEVEELAAALDSIIGQSKAPDEIHLIQDGPISLEVAKLVDSYLKYNSRINKLVVSERKGLAYALNLSILNSKHPLYARMDSDDISHPERLEKQINYLNNNLDIDIVGTWLLEFEESIKETEGQIRKVPSNQKEIYKLFHYRNPMNHPTIVFRRNVFAKVGLYNPNFKKAQDTELYARVFKNSIGVANIPEVLYYMRVNNIVEKRSTREHVKYQILGRYKYNTWNVKLNILKIISILFRFLPKKLQKLVYERFKW